MMNIVIKKKISGTEKIISSVMRVELTKVSLESNIILTTRPQS